MRIFRNEETDRPALKLWGAGLDEYMLHPDYRPVWEKALQVTDLFGGAGSPFDIICGQNGKEYREVWDEPFAPGWILRHVVYHTPRGDLHGAERISTEGEPGYTQEYTIKEPEDIEKILSIPYTPFPFDRSDYDRAEEKMGDRGVALFHCDHPGYAAQRLIGSENMAFFSVDEREKLKELIETLGTRVRSHVKAALDNGICGGFSWVGPELLIPPLMGYRDFREFVVDVDKPMCDDIKNAGGHIWVHCHGKVGRLIDDFVEMGVDILNPIEPPPNGDVLLDQIVKKHGRAIGWEGNIEIQTLLQGTEELVREEIRRCAKVGKEVGRFILCPSAGYMEYTHPTREYLHNLTVYLEYGLECLGG